MLSGLLGKKLGMTQVFGAQGAAIPVTVIEAGPCTVTQIKTAATDGYEAVQIGFGKTKHATRPELGHLGHTLAQLPAQRRKQQQAQAKARAEARAKAAQAKAESEEAEAKEEEAEEAGEEETEEETGEEAAASEEVNLETQAEEAEARGKAEAKPAAAAAPARTAQRDPQRKRPGGGLGPFEVLREVRPFGNDPLQVGQQFDATMFKVGELVDVVGTSKGKGFQGVMKRHGFGGGPRTHGQSDRPRAPGSIGAGNTPGRILKNTRMAGHMGAERVTVKRLEVVAANAEGSLLLVKGSIPGPTGGLVMIRKVPESLALAERLQQQQAK
jgi:large subunit ribosomal protein L3